MLQKCRQTLISTPPNSPDLPQSLSYTLNDAHQLIDMVKAIVAMKVASTAPSPHCARSVKSPILRTPSPPPRTTRHSLVSANPPCLNNSVLRRLFRYGFRLPKSFSTHHGTNASNRYTSNIHSYDFLSHTGRRTDRNDSGLVDATFDSLGEIHELTLLAKENRKKGYSEADLKISLGPLPGSFFAEAYKLDRYQWANLPSELENEL
jgi:hypothetical protein